MKTALILATAVALASPLAGAQGPGQGRGMGMMGDGRMGQGMMGPGTGPGMGAQQGGAERLDADKIAEQQKKVDELRRQMLKSRVEAHNQIAALLTPEQRKELRERAPRWMMDGNE